MSRLATAPFEIPDETLLEPVALDALRSPALQAVARYWSALRGERLFPTRDEVNPAGFASALRHMALVRVIDDGADFEFRIIGDSLASAFSVPIQNHRLSEVATSAASSVRVIGAVYRRCIQSRQPLAHRGTTGRNAETAMFTHFEALVLPLGPAETTVDHLLTFMVCDRPTADADWKE